MKLHTFDGMPTMTQTHDGTGAIFFGCPGTDLQLRGKMFFLDDERMIARGSHRHGHALKHGAVVMHDSAGLAVHDMGRANHASAEGFPDSLVSQTNAEQGNLSCEIADQINADARVLRCAGPWRDQNAFGPHRFDFAYRHLIVTTNLHLRTQLADVLDEVVGE